MSNEIPKATKVSAEEAKTLDRSRMGVSVVGQADVEGQDPYIGRIQCGHCGITGRVILDTDFYKYFTCGNCGNTGKA